MNRYVPPIPRAAFGVAAVAATAMVIALAVVAPAKVDTLSTVARAPEAFTPAAREVAVLDRVEIVAVRDSNVVSAHTQDARAKRKQQI